MHTHDDDRRVLDPELLRQYTDGDDAIALALYRRFFEQTKDDAALLRTALAGGSAPEIAAAAHRIRGSSLMVGAAGQSGIAGRIENAAAGGDLPSARAVLDEFEREHARLLERLAAFAGAGASDA